MRLLYVTEVVPNRDPTLGDGSSMIPYEVLRALPPDVRVTLLTFASDVAVPTQVRDRCERLLVLRPRRPRVALLASVSGRYDVAAAARATAQAVAEVRRLSAGHDVTLVHGPQVLFLARRVVGPVVVQTVDPWSIRLRMDRQFATGWRALYRGRKSRQALAVERGLPARARLLTVGESDARTWSDLLGRPVRSIANGVDPAARPPRRAGPPVICFVGSLNYGPNIASATTLVRTVAPKLWQTEPAARIVIAGRQPTAEVLALEQERVHVLANVASVLEVFHAADVAVFADEHGLGVRNSVREALAAGLPVVATPAAAREQQPHQALYVEDGPERIVDRVRALIRNASGPADWAGPVPDERTWRDVASDYLAELEAARHDLHMSD